MTSQRKREANRQNSRKSTGPKTKSGKRKSSLNALTTGLYSSSPLLPDQNPRAHIALYDALREELKPVGTMEEEIVRNILSDIWRLRRLDRAERVLVNRVIEKRLNETTKRMSAKASKAWESLAELPEVMATLSLFQEETIHDSANGRHIFSELARRALEEPDDTPEEYDAEHGVHPSAERRALALKKFMETFDIGAALLGAIVPEDGGKGMEHLDRQRRAIRKDLLNSYAALRHLQDRRPVELSSA